MFVIFHQQQSLQQFSNKSFSIRSKPVNPVQRDIPISHSIEIWWIDSVANIVRSEEINDLNGNCVRSCNMKQLDFKWLLRSFSCCCIRTEGTALLHYERIFFFFCILYFDINNAFNFWFCFYWLRLKIISCAVSLKPYALIKQFKNSNVRPQTDTSVETIFMKWMKWWKMLFWNYSPSIHHHRHRHHPIHLKWTHVHETYYEFLFMHAICDNCRFSIDGNRFFFFPTRSGVEWFFQKSINGNTHVGL